MRKTGSFNGLKLTVCFVGTRENYYHKELTILSKIVHTIVYM